jgi:hypothetical protein
MRRSLTTHTPHTQEWAATVIRPFYEERILNAAVDGWRPSKPHFRSDRGEATGFVVCCLLCWR